MPLLPLLSRRLLLFACAAFVSLVRADNRVVVTATADEAYTEKKYGHGAPRRETYVFMQGRYYPGATVDKSADETSFRQIASYLQPRLAQQQFVAAKTVQEADLLLIVHWGVTNPRVSMLEMMGRTSPYSDRPANERMGEGPDGLNQFDGLPTNRELERDFDALERANDAMSAEQRNRDIAALLGYSDSLRKMQGTFATSAAEATLRTDMATERYFIIVKAYDLKGSLGDRKPRTLWTMNMNVSSPGNNFRTALTRMSEIAPQFIGRTTDGVETIRSKGRDVKVELGDLIILGTER